MASVVDPVALINAAFPGITVPASDLKLDPKILSDSKYDFNGPEEVGIAAAAEASMTDQDKICFNPAVSAMERAVVAYLASTPPSASSNKAKLLYRIGAAWVAYGNWASDKEITPGASAAITARLTQEAVDEVRAAMWGDLQKAALLLLYAPIVTFWMTNHHTGGSPVSGFTRKVMLLHLEDSGSLRDEDVTAVWRMGHWIDKRLLFAAWGIHGADKNLGDHARMNANVPFPKMTRDIDIRMRGPPAGLHKLTTVKAILERAANSDLAALIPIPTDMHTIFQNVRDAMKQGAYCHVGSFYLTGKNQVVYADPSEEAMRIASAFAHSALTGTSMSRAKVIMPVQEVQSDNLYANITSVKLSALDRKFSVTEIESMIGKAKTGLTSMRDIVILNEADHKQAMKDVQDKIDALKAVPVMKGSQEEIDLNTKLREFNLELSAVTNALLRS